MKLRCRQCNHTLDLPKLMRAISQNAHNSMTPEQRTARARKAVNARWDRYKIAKDQAKDQQGLTNTEPTKD